MNNMYKCCIYCGAELYRDESRCRYCRKWQNKFDDSYDQPPQYDDRYENYERRSDRDCDEDCERGYRFRSHSGHAGCDSYPPDGQNFRAPRRQMSGVEIGAIVVVVVLVGLIIFLLF